jgi:hypothetical protein
VPSFVARDLRTDWRPLPGHSCEVCRPHNISAIRLDFKWWIFSLLKFVPKLVLLKEKGTSNMHNSGEKSDFASPSIFHLLPSLTLLKMIILPSTIGLHLSLFPLNLLSLKIMQATPRASPSSLLPPLLESRPHSNLLYMRPDIGYADI